MYEYNCVVTRVVDGDTVDVDIDLGFDVILREQRIRLANIDAPEVRTRDLNEKEYGLYVKEVVTNFINRGPAKFVSTEYNPTGKYGRIIGDIIVDGESLCQYLINNHCATLYENGDRNKIKAKHIINMQILKEQGKL